MNLQDLGNVSQFIGGIAIVISLVYLAIQVRQNTSVHSSAAWHQAAEQIWLFNSAVMQSADMARIMFAGMRATKAGGFLSTSRAEWRWYPQGCAGAPQVLEPSAG